MAKQRRRYGRESLQSIAHAFENAPIAMSITRNRVVVHCNERLAQLLRGTPEQIVGQSLIMLYPSEQEFHRRGIHTLKTMMRTGCYEADSIVKRLDGSLFWVKVSGRTLNRADPMSYVVWYYEELAQSDRYAKLSAREREVAAALVEGMTNKEIARRLVLSRRTVEMHRANLMKKLGAKNLSSALNALLSR